MKKSTKKKRDTHRVKNKVVKVGGEKRVLHTVHNHRGKVVNSFFSHLSLDFKMRDMVQLIVGSSLLAIPVGFTEETWRLGGSLPMLNVLILVLISMFFIAIFVYYNSYRHHIQYHWDEYLKRVVATYFVSFIVVGVLLHVIQVTPWMTDALVAFKRVAIVTFPASMSAAVADMIK